MDEKDELELLRSAARDSDWFSAHFNEILKKFDGEFVAIKNQAVVASSRSFDDVLSKIRERGFDPVRVKIKYVTSVHTIL